MNQELGFETMPFEIAPEFPGELFEEESEWGRRGRFDGGGGRYSRPGSRPGPRPGGAQRPPIPRPRPILRGPRGPRAVVREPYGLVSEPYPGGPEPASSERVRWVQDCLNQSSGLQLAVTGVMGPETRSAVRSFQRERGLRASGIVGPDTEEALRAACSGQSATLGDAGDNSEEAEIGPLTATVTWLKNSQPVDATRNPYLFSLEQAGNQKKDGGVYILIGDSIKNPQDKGRILKAGMTLSFSQRFARDPDYRSSVKKIPKEWKNLRVYLGRVTPAESPATQIERAIARLFYRAGEELPGDFKPPREGNVRGQVQVKNILPPTLEGYLRRAYKASGTETRTTSGGKPRTITPRSPAVPLPGAPGLLDLTAFSRWEVSTTTDKTQEGEIFQTGSPVIHPINCTCTQCRMTREFEWTESEFPGLGEVYGETGFETPFSETEELELAAELLSVASEAEMDLFLGKLVRGAWKGIKKVGSVVGKIAKPLGGVLKGVAKAALPFVGGALGSFIPIPGVGTALGSALGGALSKALEMEFGQLEQEEQELEMARRFVRLAGSAARQAALASADADPQQAAEMAVVNAARQQVPNLPVNVTGGGLTPGRPAGSAPTGRWVRRGNQIAVLNV